jgi:hypothetical protein
MASARPAAGLSPIDDDLRAERDLLFTQLGIVAVAMPA